MDIWKSYLDANQIEYTYKPWVIRGQITGIKIWKNDKESMKATTENFGMKLWR